MNKLSYGLLLAMLPLCSRARGMDRGMDRDVNGEVARNMIRGAARDGGDTTITLTLELDKASASMQFAPALFKYNKDLAWSFTLDDGYIAGKLVAFPFFNGGLVAGPYKDQWGADQGGDGKMHPGLFYTDGCGGRKPFTAALAINAASLANGAVPNPGNLSWVQLDSMYKAGWDIYNHGYRHATGEGVDAEWEVRQNNEAVLERLGCKMSQFVVPGGKGDSISEGPYTMAAFNQGMLTVHCGRFAIDWGVPERVPSLKGVRAGRWFISSKWLGPEGTATYFSNLDGLLREGEKVWINAFTHSVGNDDLWNISLRFQDFSRFFNELAARYGSDGKDNMWMATYQAVQEYQLLRKDLRYKTVRRGRKVICTIDTGVLPVRHRDMSFVLKSDAAIKKVKCRGCSVESYSGSLVNISW